MGKKKANANTPRVKRMKREGRLQSAAANKQARKEKRRQYQEEQLRSAVPWSDETYAYIAGYTMGGFPYGVTWEEMERLIDQESLDRTVPPRSREAEEVPFDLEAFMISHDEY